MVIDFKNRGDHASRWDVIDAETGQNISHLCIVYADDEAGVIRRVALDDRGLMHIDPATAGVALLPEERRAIRIVPKEFAGV